MGRDAGHFGADHSGAAHRAAGQMDEMKIVGDTVDGHVGGHRRDDHSIFQGESADGERCEHRRHGVIDTVLRGEPLFDVLDVGGVAQFEIFVADALAAGEQAVGELLRLEVDVALDLLEPFHAIAGGALQFQSFDFAVGLIALKGVGDFARS